MANYFIGGVANVAAYNGNELVFRAKTLTDSSINISVSAEEIRGGEGAQLLGKFFHTTVFNVSLTDALFDMNYIAKQVGATQINASGVSFEFKCFPVTVKTGEPTTYEVDLTKGSGSYTIYRLDGSTSGALLGYDADNTSHALTAGTGNKYSVANGENLKQIFIPVQVTGEQVQVNAQYIPSTFSLQMEAKLFEGNATSASNASYAGKVIIEVPRFQLDGTIDLAMAMSSPATYAMNGSALANESEGCDGTYYARITKIVNTASV